MKKSRFPELNPESVIKLNNKEMMSVKGGFLSIGHACSHRTKCDRLWTKCWGDTNGSEPGGECTHEDILNAAG
jgi:hypothetical protein